MQTPMPAVTRATAPSVTPAGVAVPIIASTQQPAPVIGGVDGVTGTLKSGGVALVVGWAVDLQFGAPVTRVDVVLDNKQFTTAKLGDERPDVSRALNRSDARFAGWTADLNLSGITPGEHTITLMVYDAQQRPYILPFTFTFLVRADE